MTASQNQIVEVDFHGDRLQAVQDERGVWVSVLKVCEALAVARQAQQAKLKSKAWATSTMIVLVGSDGKQRDQMMLHLDCLPMWLATIETSRVKPGIRSKLELYQRECAKVLADHFFGRKQSAPATDPVLLAILQRMDERLSKLETEEKEKPIERAPQFVPTGSAIGIVEQIRRLWKTATQKQIRRCSSRVQAVCMQKGIQVWKPLNNGPYAIAEAFAYIINDVVCEIRELDESPLFSRFAARQSVMSN